MVNIIHFTIEQKHKRQFLIQERLSYLLFFKLYQYLRSMEILVIMAILYFFIGAGICLLICVNPNDTGILAKMNRFAFRTVPSIFSNFVRRVFGETVLGWLGSFKYWLMETNHPLVQWFYLLIAVGGFIGYTWKGIFKHMPNKYVGDWQVIVANCLAFTCFFVYYKCCSVSPGQVKQSNYKKAIDKYEQHYDDVLYRKNNKCKTCKLPKPARSKHCSICKMCVMKFDHHCIWIRQCVGERNYKYFVSFLLMHGVWCTYLSIIGALSLYAYCQNINIWQQTIRNEAGQAIKVDNLVALQFLLVTQTLFFFLIFMCAIMGVTLLIFVSYHFYLISKGNTTNQRVKKNDEIDYYHRQIAYLSKIEEQNGGVFPKQHKYGKQIFKKDELQKRKQYVKKSLAILQKKQQNLGFWKNLKIVFSEPDHD